MALVANITPTETMRTSFSGVWSARTLYLFARGAPANAGTNVRCQRGVLM
jgi:hypothetical protein